MISSREEEDPASLTLVNTRVVRSTPSPWSGDKQSECVRNKDVVATAHEKGTATAISTSVSNKVGFFWVRFVAAV